MSPSDVTVPKVKRIESKNKTDNHNAAKRAKRAAEKTKKKYERLRFTSTNALTIGALFTCIRRFPTHELFCLLSVRVLTGLLKAVRSIRTMPSPDDLNTLRCTYLQLSTLNACDFIAELLESLIDDVEVAQECVEVWHLFLRPITSYCYHYDSPNIINVCRNPRIESLVVWVFNEHEQHSTTDAYAQHCLGLMVVFVSNDAFAKYRPEMCQAVVMASQKYAGNDVVLTICNQAIKELSKNIQNKDKLHIIVSDTCNVILHWNWHTLYTTTIATTFSTSINRYDNFFYSPTTICT